MLSKVVLTFECVYETLNCDNSKESYCAVFSCGAVYYSIVTLKIHVPIQMKAIERYFPVVLFIMLCKVVLTFESVDEILKCDHINESY